MPFPKIIGPDGREIKRDKYTVNKLKKLHAAHGLKWEPWPLNNVRQRESDAELKEAQEAKPVPMRNGRPIVPRKEEVVEVRSNRHRKRYEEERRRAEGLKTRRMWDDEDESSDPEHGLEEEKQVDCVDNGLEGGVEFEHMLKVRVVKAKRGNHKQFEILSPVRNVVALDDDDFGEPSSRAPLPLDFGAHLDLDEWEEVDSSDADESDDAFRECKDDIELGTAKGPSYARVTASTPSEKQAWLVESV